jgi:Zn-dependent M28 family amino/carboxypeptidase
MRTPRLRLWNRRTLRRLGLLFALIGVGLLLAWNALLRMPGSSHRGPLPSLTPEQSVLAAELRSHVEVLASSIGRRSTFHPKQLAESALYLKTQLASSGYEVRDHSFAGRGSPAPNLEATLAGTSLASEIIVIGAHYDSYQGTPGADDNASGCAAVLALAKRFANTPQPRTIRFVLFPNEEPPLFQTPEMGSLIYAKACRAANDNIIAMLSLETIGYYRDEPGSQKYPPLIGGLFPSEGNFIAFVSDVSSRGLLKRVVATFREHAAFPSEGAALPNGVPGVGWSDHWAFWQVGYPALMVTDTAPFRNPNYHLPTDTPNTLDCERMARVVDGLGHVIRSLAVP